MDYEQSREWRVELPRTARAWRRGKPADEIESILDDELCDKGAELVGERGLENGGWPDDEQVEIVSVRVTKKELVAKVTISYNEVMSTGCAEINHSEDREERVVLTMTRDSDWADIEYSEEGFEDIADENSANDGR